MLHQEWSKKKINYGSSAARIVFSPDGSKIATSNHGIIQIWDVVTGVELQKINYGSRAAFSYGAYRTAAIVFSPDGSKIATSNSVDIAQIWDIENGDGLRSLDISDDLAAVSPDGSKIATKGYGMTVQIYEVEPTL